MGMISERIDKEKATMIVFFVFYLILAPLSYPVISSFFTVSKEQVTLLFQLVTSLIIIGINLEEILEKKDSFIIKGIILAIVSQIFYFIWIIVLSNAMELPPSSNTSEISSMLVNHKLLTYITVCITAPVTEEIVFRKTVYEIGERFLGKILGGLIAILLFASCHCISDFASGIYSTVLYYVPMGICYQIAYAKTRNININVVAHLSMNLISILMM